MHSDALFLKNCVFYAKIINLPMEIASKQWKQQLQYALQGRDYQTLITTTSEGIPILPFYTEEHVGEPFTIKGRSRVGVHLFCSDPELTLQRMQEFHNSGVDLFLVTLIAPCTYEQLPEQLRIEGVQVLWTPDPLIDAFRRGILPPNTLRTDLPSPLQLNATLYREAGASLTHQMAYALAQIKEYETDNDTADIYLRVAVGEALLLEIAALRALRKLLREQFPKRRTHIVAEVLQRRLTLVRSNYNKDYISLAYEAAALGQADFIITQTSDFYRYKNEMKEHTQIQNLLSIIKKSSVGFINEAYSVQALTKEIYHTVSLKYEHIQSQGGLLNFYQKEQLQWEIKRQNKREQQEFDAQLIEAGITPENTHIYGEEHWNLYPFTKKLNAITKFFPLIPKRLWQNFELTSIKQA